MGLILKVLLCALVVLVVWWVVKFRGRVSVLKAAMNAAKKMAQNATSKPAASSPTVANKVPVTLVACPKCGTYIATGIACNCS